MKKTGGRQGAMTVSKTLITLRHGANALRKVTIDLEGLSAAGVMIGSRIVGPTFAGHTCGVRAVSSVLLLSSLLVLGTAQNLFRNKTFILTHK